MEPFLEESLRDLIQKERELIEFQLVSLQRQETYVEALNELLALLKMLVEKERRSLDSLIKR